MNDIHTEALITASRWQREAADPIRTALGPGCLLPRRPLDTRPVYRMSYVNGAFVELQYYANSDVAKRMSDIGWWIELPDNGGWRSEDGRDLIVPEPDGPVGDVKLKQLLGGMKDCIRQDWQAWEDV